MRETLPKPNVELVAVLNELKAVIEKLPEQMARA